MKLVKLLLRIVILSKQLFLKTKEVIFMKNIMKKFEELTGLNGHFVQDNISKSTYGVLRGLHLQKMSMLRQN